MRVSACACLFFFRIASAKVSECEDRILDDSWIQTAGQPPREMPHDKVQHYTRCGTIPVEKYFVADGKSSYRYDRVDIDARIENWKRTLAAPLGQTRMNPNMKFLVQALVVHQELYVQNRRVLVYGAMAPDIETLLLALGAEAVVTIEHNVITFDHPQLLQVTAAEFAARSGDDVEFFQSAVSQSSFDHDGLGRYGDPLNADADLVAMDRARASLVEGGIMFLTVPVGPDVVVWNLHRRYGEVRLPLLLNGWERVGDVGFETEKLTAAANFKRSYEPVFILRRVKDPEQDHLAHNASDEL